MLAQLTLGGLAIPSAKLFLIVDLTFKQVLRHSGNQNISSGFLDFYHISFLGSSGKLVIKALSLFTRSGIWMLTRYLGCGEFRYYTMSRAICIFRFI